MLLAVSPCIVLQLVPVLRAATKLISREDPPEVLGANPGSACSWCPCLARSCCCGVWKVARLHMGSGSPPQKGWGRLLVASASAGVTGTISLLITSWGSAFRGCVPGSCLISAGEAGLCLQTLWSMCPSQLKLSLGGGAASSLIAAARGILFCIETSDLIGSRGFAFRGVQQASACSLQAAGRLGQAPYCLTVMSALHDQALVAEGQCQHVLILQAWQHCDDTTQQAQAVVCLVPKVPVMSEEWPVHSSPTGWHQASSGPHLHQVLSWRRLGHGRAQKVYRPAARVELATSLLWASADDGHVRKQLHAGQFTPSPGNSPVQQHYPALATRC